MARKRGMQFIPYDYEAAYNKAMEDMHEWFIENLFQHRKKVIYALKEITAGDQFEIEIYPQFRSMDEVPPEGRTIKKDNNKAQKNLNDKNARKYVERLINENFSDRDIWMTLTYDDAHLPPDGDVDAAIKNVQKYIRRINYQRKKRGLPNAKYVYVTAYNPDAEIRWHHHIVMDGALDMETVESCWKQSSRNEVRRLQTDENGLSGMANYIVEEKNRVPSEKRWNSSQGLRDPRIKVVHSKRPAAGGSYKKIGSFVDGMVKDRDSIPEILKKWYPDMDFTNANVYYNDFNCMISNCGHDENNRYRGGKAGDQTGTEWRVINWYNRPWKCVLRHPDAKVRKMIASMAKAAAVNNKIGYDQSERYTFWEHLKASNYDPAQITIACEADCSSGVAAIVKGAGYRLGNEKMKNVSIYLDTGNMRAGLKAAGFEVLTDSKYLTSDAYLLEGDILLNDNAHVATNLTDGAKSSGTGASNTTPVKSNTKVDVAHGFNKSLAGTYKVTASGLNLRAGAGTGKSILAVMKNGEKVQCYGYYNDCNGVKWLYVVYKNIVGYASSKYLSK